MQHFHRLADEHGQQQARELVLLLEQASRIDGWLASTLPDGLEEHLRRERRQVHDQMAALLLRWHRAGGTVALTTPRVPGLAPEPPAAEAPEVHLDASPAENAATAEPTEEVPAAPVVPAPTLEPPLPDQTKTPTPAVARADSRPAAMVDLTALKNHIESGGNFSAGLPAPDWRTRLDRIVDELADAPETFDEVGSLLKVLEGRDAWVAMPAQVQVALVAWFTARLRAIQVEGPQDDRLDRAFSRLSAYQKKHNTGFVHGLARFHTPKSGSWLGDADRAWDLLLDFLPPKDNEPTQTRTTATASKPSRTAESEPEEGNRPDPIPMDWRWRGWTQGRRAVMVGGDPREPNRRRLEEVFGFAELVWERSERSRNTLQQVRERVKAGKLDMVLVLSRFVGHDADQVIQPACKESGVAFVPVQTGYGVVGVRRSIERHLPPPEER